MKTFLTSRRKLIELFVLLGLNILFYLLWGSWDFIIMFSLGFIWNWAASQDMNQLFENRRYRFSTLKTVFNLQQLILKPLHKTPGVVKFFARILPAGIFWFAVIIFNDADMPWWGVFIGSFTLELILLESHFFKSQRESA
jgi:hypothetical protein